MFGIDEKLPMQLSHRPPLLTQARKGWVRAMHPLAAFGDCTKAAASDLI
jgi:hypothetical protein